MKFCPGVVPQWPEEPRLDVLELRAAPSAADCRADRSGRPRGNWRPASRRPCVAGGRVRAASPWVDGLHVPICAVSMTGERRAGRGRRSLPEDRAVNLTCRPRLVKKTGSETAWRRPDDRPRSRRDPGAGLDQFDVIAVLFQELHQVPDELDRSIAAGFEPEDGPGIELDRSGSGRDRLEPVEDSRGAGAYSVGESACSATAGRKPARKTPCLCGRFPCRDAVHHEAQTHGRPLAASRLAGHAQPDPAGWQAAPS